MFEEIALGNGMAQTGLWLRFAVVVCRQTGGIVRFFVPANLLGMTDFLNGVSEHFVQQRHHDLDRNQPDDDPFQRR